MSDSPIRKGSRLAPDHQKLSDKDRRKLLSLLTRMRKQQLQVPQMQKIVLQLLAKLQDPRLLPPMSEEQHQLHRKTMQRLYRKLQDQGNPMPRQSEMRMQRLGWPLRQKPKTKAPLSRALKQQQQRVLQQLEMQAP
jgi:hypothetical protein